MRLRDMLYAKAGMGKGTAKPRISANPVSFDGVASELPEYVYFTVTATGASLSYQWQYSLNGGSTWSNSPASGNKTATLTVEPTEARYGNMYRCRVTSGGVTVISAPVKLSWTGVRITSGMNAETEVEKDATLTLSVTAIAHGVTGAVTWGKIHDGVLTVLADSDTDITITNESLSDGVSATTVLTVAHASSHIADGDDVVCIVSDGKRETRTQTTLDITTITFAVETASGANTYTADKGMTWAEYAESDYNDGKFAVVDDAVTYDDKLVVDVSADDVIVDDATYELIDE